MNLILSHQISVELPPLKTQTIQTQDQQLFVML